MERERAAVLPEDLKGRVGPRDRLRRALLVDGRGMEPEDDVRIRRLGMDLLRRLVDELRHDVCDEASAHLLLARLGEALEVYAVAAHRLPDAPPVVHDGVGERVELAEVVEFDPPAPVESPVDLDAPAVGAFDDLARVHDLAVVPDDRAVEAGTRHFAERRVVVVDDVAPHPCASHWRLGRGGVFAGRDPLAPEERAGVAAVGVLQPRLKVGHDHVEEVERSPEHGGGIVAGDDDDVASVFAHRLDEIPAGGDLLVAEERTQRRVLRGDADHERVTLRVDDIAAVLLERQHERRREMRLAQEIRPGALGEHFEGAPLRTFRRRVDHLPRAAAHRLRELLAQ